MYIIWLDLDVIWELIKFDFSKKNYRQRQNTSRHAGWQVFSFSWIIEPLDWANLVWPYCIFVGISCKQIRPEVFVSLWKWLIPSRSQKDRAKKYLKEIIAGKGRRGQKMQNCPWKTMWQRPFDRIDVATANGCLISTFIVSAPRAQQWAIGEEGKPRYKRERFLWQKNHYKRNHHTKGNFPSQNTACNDNPIRCQWSLILE